MRLGGLLLEPEQAASAATLESANRTVTLRTLIMIFSLNKSTQASAPPAAARYASVSYEWELMQMKLMRSPVGYIRCERKREGCVNEVEAMSWGR